MIKFKGRDVTFTGKDAELVQKLATLMKMTPQKAVNKALRDMIARDKAVNKALRDMIARDKAKK